MDIAAIRKDYQLAELDEATAGDDPFAFFGKWLTEAEAAQADEINAMTVATVDPDNKPHARIVLLKGLDAQGFTFFTNYNSVKGHDIAVNNNIAAVFFWKELERQVRIEGTAERLTDAENDTYFHSRPAGSRLGAWASPQSQVISSREVIENNFKLYENQFTGHIPRPAHWGGYRIIPSSIEFWQGRSSRMHDRILFSLEGGRQWKKTRLAP